MFKRILKSEFKKLAYGKMFFVSLMVLLGGLSILTLQGAIMKDMTVTVKTETGIETIKYMMTLQEIFSLLMAGTASFVAIFYAISLNAFVGREYRTTLRQTMIVVDDRKKYYLAKMIVLFVMTLLFIIAFMVLGTLVRFIFFGTKDFSVTSDFFINALNAIWFAFGLIALYQFLTVLMRNKFNIIVLVLLLPVIYLIIYTIISILDNQTITNIMQYFPTQLNELVVSGKLNDTQKIVAPIMSLVFILGSYFAGSAILSKQEL